MEALRLPVVFTIVMCLMCFKRTDGIGYRNMTDYCGSRIQMFDDHQILLYYIGSKECEVTKATPSQFPNSMLYVLSFAESCEFGNVAIRTHSLYERLCGYASLSKVYTANGDVHIKYTPMRVRLATFSFIVTLYSDLSNCPSNGHVCDNKRCIDENLKCNGYNSCGDNSGCWTNSSRSTQSSTVDNSGRWTKSSRSTQSSTVDNSGRWTNSNNFYHSSSGDIGNGVDGVGIGIGVAAGVTVLIVVSILIICCRRRRTGTPAQRARPSAPPMHVVYSTHANSVHSNEQSPPPYDPAWATNTHTNETRRSRCCSIKIECGFF